MSFSAQMYGENEDEREMVVLPVSSQRTFPPAPFPRKYIHCVFDDLDYIVQVVYALHADGHDIKDIYIMSCWDYVAAIERKRQRQSKLAKMFTSFLHFLDEGFGDMYMREALRGNHILMVRLAHPEQKKRVRDMLLRHNARHISYVDTWTVSDLSASHGVL